MDYAAWFVGAWALVGLIISVVSAPTRKARRLGIAISLALLGACVFFLTRTGVPTSDTDVCSLYERYNANCP